MANPERVMAEYGKRKAQRGWVFGIALVLLLSMLAFIDSHSVWLAVFGGGGILLGGGILDLVVWRCPVCSTWLGSDWDYTFCPHCAVRLHL